MHIWSAEIKELEKLYESLKGQSPDVEKELGRLIKADDENMILEDTIKERTEVQEKPSKAGERKLISITSDNIRKQLIYFRKAGT